MRGDSKARSTYYHNGITDGWLTRNEARIRENLDPLDGLDKPLQPLNMAPADAAAESAASDSADSNATPAGEDGAAPTDQTDQARLCNLEASIVARIVRKEVAAVRKARERTEGAEAGIREFYVKHIDYVAEALAVSRETARDYCEHQAAGALAGREDIGVRARDRLLILGANK